MRCNQVTRFLVAISTATVIGTNSVVFVESLSPGKAIADTNGSGCKHPNGCFPPPEPINQSEGDR